MQIFCSFPRLLVVIFLVELFDVFVVVVFFYVCVFRTILRRCQSTIYSHIQTVNRFSRV